MKIRELKTKDTFPISRILRKLDLKEVISLLTAGSEQGGLLLVALLVERLDSLEVDLMAFLGDLVGMTAAEFSEQPFSVLKDVLLQLAQSPEVAGFFASISKTPTSTS
jgi:hypothetical protein